MCYNVGGKEGLMLTFIRSCFSAKDKALIIRWTGFLTILHTFFIWFVWWYFVGGDEGVPMPYGKVSDVIPFTPVSRWWDIFLFPLCSLTLCVITIFCLLFASDADKDFEVVSDYLYDKKVLKYQSIIFIFVMVHIGILFYLFSTVVGGLLFGINFVLTDFIIAILISLVTLLFTGFVRRIFYRTSWWRWRTIKNYMLAKDKT